MSITYEEVVIALEEVALIQKNFAKTYPDLEWAQTRSQLTEALVGMVQDEDLVKAYVLRAEARKAQEA